MDIRVKLKSKEDIKVHLKPKQSIKLRNKNVYVYDPNIIGEYVELAEDWAKKTDGLVEEEDYSAKAYAIGGTGTETNNSKYYAEQASNSAGAAATSETNAGVSESNALTYATNAGNSATLASNKASEAAVSATSASTSAGTATAQAVIAKGHADNAADSATTATTQAGIATTQAGIATTQAGNAASSASAASGSALSAATSATNASVWAEGTDEQVQALGGTHSAKVWVNTLGTVYKPGGSVAFENLPTLSADHEGYVYNVNNAFTTTSDFVEGAGKSYPAGTNVICIDVGSSVYKWDTLSGFVDLSPYRTSANQDLIDATKANVDLSNLSATGEAKFDAKQDTLTAGTDLEIVGGSSLATVDGTVSVTLTNAVAMNLAEVSLTGACSQTGTPTPSNPVNIVCNNGILKWDSVNNVIYTDGTTETVTDELGNTATAQKLLALGDYKDVQDVISGNITRNIGIKVLDGTENWNSYNVTQGVLFRTQISNSASGAKSELGVYCNYYDIVASGERGDGTLTGSARNYDFINNSYSDTSSWKTYLAGLYSNGTPVIIVYPLDTAISEAVSGQTLTAQAGTNSIEITQASINNLPLSVKYYEGDGSLIINFTNDTGYITGITSSDVTTALGYTPYSDANPNGYTSNVGTVTSVNNTSPDGNGNVTLSIPTVNDATLTIQKNGVDVQTFTANASANATANITVPTDTADLTNGAGFITSSALPTVNNSTIEFTQGGVSKGSFTLNQATGATIALDAGGGSVTTDGVTINTNADDELQAIGVIEKNAGNVKYDWVGTTAEYTAQNVKTLHPEWVCYITDDEISAVGDYVVSWKTPTSSDKTWYRKYASGWVEQGGIIGESTTSGYPKYTITLPVEMADTNYTVQVTGRYTQDSGNGTNYCYASTTTTISIVSVGHGSFWEVKGMAL